MDIFDLFTIPILAPRETNPDPLWEFEDIRRSYRAAHPELSEDQSHLLMAQVFGRARLNHPDFDEFLNLMAVATKWLVPSWKALTLDDFTEILYCVAKYADFTKEFRKEASRRLCQPSIQ